MGFHMAVLQYPITALAEDRRRTDQGFTQIGTIIAPPVEGIQRMESGKLKIGKLAIGNSGKIVPDLVNPLSRGASAHCRADARRLFAWSVRSGSGRS
jgi:hypothetical protein